jgi:hypothetical protein
MSGIFKGDSIYKSGGGGGGYKDGGQLVDGDFIEVKNNTVSSYDNVSRDPVNFYFEVKDGEILNSVVELTTAVNSTVYVYVFKNGIYYLLGNVGGDTVNAGEDYKVNIIGDSYSIEQVSDKPTPAFINIGNIIYPCKKIGNLIWTTSHCRNEASAFDITEYWPIGKPSPQSTYPGYFYNIRKNEHYRKINNKIYPFRLPTVNDIEDLKTASGNSANKLLSLGFSGCPNATDELNFSAIPCGSFNIAYGVSSQGYECNFGVFDPDAYGSIERTYSVGKVRLIDNGVVTTSFTYQNDSYANIRFCMNV